MERVTETCTVGEAIQRAINEAEQASRKDRLPNGMPIPKGEAAASVALDEAVPTSSDLLCFELPWPPSMNHYWRRVGAKTLISRDGRKFRREVLDTIFELSRQFEMRRLHVTGRLSVEIDAYPPDRRRRDLDNVLKPLLDALQHAGVYDDDSQIDSLKIVRRGLGGKVIVEVREVQ